MLSKDDCLRELISLTDNDKVITRKFFRDATGISDINWERHFGNFTEFKRAAGLNPSRHEIKINNDVAKHASLENYQKINEVKQKWEGDYNRPSGKRFQTILVISDVHDINCDDFTLNLFVDTVYRIKPERIVLNGDIFDLPEFSKYTCDPREYDVVGRIEWVHKFLLNIREASPDSQIDFVEGNHEFRLLKHLAEASPGLRILLSDLHGMSIPNLLGLTKYQINYYARGDLKAFNKTDINDELSKNYIICNDQVLFHHFPQGKNMGYPGAHGHHHKHIVWNNYSPQFSSFEWHQLGSGHKRQASYTAGEKWSNGFLITHLDTVKKRTQFEYIDTSNDHCFIGGKFFKRTTRELE